MPEIIGDFSHLEEKLPTTSAWQLDHVGVADVDEVVDNRVDFQRRDSSDNLFEIVPQCLIRRCDDGGGGGDQLANIGLNPANILSTVGGSDTVGIVLEKEFLILEKDSSLESVRRVKFNSTIDFVLWRRSIILVGLSSSEIVLVDPSTYEIKESKKVSTQAASRTERFFVDAALHSNPDPTKIDVVAVGRNGSVYLFPNISLSDGTLDSTHDQNMSVDIDVCSVRGTIIHCLDSDTAVVNYAASPSRNILILGEENGTVSLHDIEVAGGLKKALFASQTINIVEELGYNSTDVFIQKFTAFEGLLFLLLSNGKLEILLDNLFSPTGELELPDDRYVVHDFALVLTSEGDVKMWVLYGTYEFSMNFVGIFGGPSFTLEFAVQIPKLSIQKGVKVCRMLFPSQVSALEEPSAFLEVSSIGTAVYRMLETSTESTIQKLLSRGKFDQAAALATQYGKDLDIVYKAKIRAKYNELLSTLEPRLASAVFEELIETLEKIKDASFVCDFCAQRGFSDLNWIRRLLSIGKSRVKECSLSESGKHLLLTVKKFFTFEQVFPNASIQEWVEFVSEQNTMFQQCTWFLTKHEFSKCEKVWRRHFDEFIPGIKLDNFGPFLYILFCQKLKSNECVSLFKCILPFAVEKCAESQPESSPNQISSLDSFQLGKVDMLVDIVKRQVCSLEREKCWPIEAIEFSKIIINIVQEILDGLRSSRNRVELRIATQILICKEILEKMESVVQNLVELGDLKKNHSIRIPFQQYIDDDVVEVVNSMLFELFHRLEIETFINKFLTPFARRKCIEVDKLFSEHIKAVVSDLPFHINSIDIPQEERLICLVSHTLEIESKLRCVLTVAEDWPVPWSPNIDAMVLESLRLTPRNPVCVEVQKKINIMRIQVPFRCLLNKHRLTATKVHSYCQVVMALKRIIFHGKEDYYQDCLEFIKHTGKVDETKLKSIEFSMKLMSDAPINTLVMANWDTVLLKRLLCRSLQEFRSGDLHVYTEKEMQRITTISKVLANILDDRKAIEFLKLRDIIPTLSNLDVVYEETYPLCILANIMPVYVNKSTTEIIGVCQKLCDITFVHFSDVIVAAAAFYTQTGNDSDKVWGLIEKIVKTPGCVLGRSSRLVENSALAVAQFLMCRCPEADEEKLAILEEFLAILTSFDSRIQEVTQMLGNLQIFSALREQEIPLESEFRQIYLWMYLEGLPYGPDDLFFSSLKSFGTTILRFGDKNLFQQAFGSIVKEFFNRMSTTGGDQRTADSFKLYAKRTQSLQKELYRAYDTIMEPETDREVIHLVKTLLQEADIIVTPYALRQRNKSRFLNKLLSLNKFSLAAHVAIVFEVYSDSDAWSKILDGFMKAGNVGELRKVLLDLRNVSELWMLPEFAEGWKKVSESDKGFLDICPIPLD